MYRLRYCGISSRRFGTNHIVRHKEIGKNQILVNQKYCLQLKNAVVRNDPAEFVTNLRVCAEKTRHPEFMYSTLYTTMNSRWIGQFKIDDLADITDSLLLLRFNCSVLVETDSMKQSTSTKGKVVDHLLEQRNVFCRLFYHVIFLNDSIKFKQQQTSPTVIIDILSTMVNCGLKLDHFIDYSKKFSTSQQMGTATVFDSLKHLIPLMTGDELCSFLLSIYKMNVTWDELSADVQQILLTYIVKNVDEFNSTDSSSLLHTLSHMNFMLLNHQTSQEFRFAVYNLIRKVFKDKESDSYLLNCENILITLAKTGIALDDLPYKVGSVLIQFINHMKPAKVDNMIHILSKLKLDKEMLEDDIAKRISQYDRSNNVEPLNFINNESIFKTASRTTVETAMPEVVLNNSVDDSIQEDVDSSTVREIEKMMQQELNTTFDRRDNKKFLEYLKAILEMDTSSLARQGFFSNDSIYYRFFSLDWLEKLEPELSINLIECLSLMNTIGQQMHEKKLCWTLIAKYLNTGPNFEENEEHYFIFMKFIESIGAYFNKNEIINLLVTLPSLDIVWSMLPTSVQLVIFRGIINTSKGITPADILKIISPLAQLKMNHFNSVEDKKIIVDLAAFALTSFTDDLRYAIGGRKGAGEVMKAVSCLPIVFVDFDSKAQSTIYKYLNFVVRKQNLPQVYECIQTLSGLQFFWTPAHTNSVLQVLFMGFQFMGFQQPLESGGSRVELLERTIESLHCMKVTADMLTEDQCQTLVSCLTENISIVSQMPQLVEKLELVQISVSSPMMDIVQKILEPPVVPSNSTA